MSAAWTGPSQGQVGLSEDARPDGSGRVRGDSAARSGEPRRVPAASRTGAGTQGAGGPQAGQEREVEYSQALRLAGTAGAARRGVSSRWAESAETCLPGAASKEHEAVGPARLHDDKSRVHGTPSMAGQCGQPGACDPWQERHSAPAWPA